MNRSWGALAFAAWAAACGGIAVIDDPGGAASGGANAGGSDVGAFGPTSSTMSSSVGGASAGCQAACALLGPCLQTMGCESSCSAVNPTCRTLHEDWLACVVGSTTSNCQQTASCFAQLNAWHMCETLVATVGTCSGLAPDCDCFVETNTMHRYDSQCSDSGCTCFVDDVQVGSCSSEGSLQCEPFAGCCSLLFFVDGLP